MSKWFLKGFTLAEIMVAFTVIGILGGVLIPVAMKSKPDENLLKFKKAHETLINAVGQLVERLYNERCDIVQHTNSIKTHRNYKIICTDIDGINKGEPPFGYGINVEGKIILGTHVKEWLEKDIKD